MRLSEICLTEDASNRPPLNLKVDNPGGKWLEDKASETMSSGRNEHGFPKTPGTVTAHFDRPVLLPVKLLTKIKGARGEQANVRSDSLEWLEAYMRKNKKLPNSGDGDKEYVPFVAIMYNGEPFVMEGNHRIMAAARSGFAALPVEIKYFTGGEQADGMLTPEFVKKVDKDAFDRGYDFGEYIKK
jgi:hypothetical protein